MRFAGYMLSLVTYYDHIVCRVRENAPPFTNLYNRSFLVANGKRLFVHPDILPYLQSLLITKKVLISQDFTVHHFFEYFVRLFFRNIQIIKLRHNIRIYICSVTCANTYFVKIKQISKTTQTNPFPR